MRTDHGTPGIVIGVDAGGTKTRALAATIGPHDRCCLLGVGVSGPGNPLSGGVEQAARSIEEAIRLALPDGASAEHAVIAVAGAATPTPRRALTERLAGLARVGEFEVVPDYAPLFARVESERPAIAMIVGTGSVAFCRDAHGVVQRHGGWGYLLGDEGSGYQIGRAAVRAVLADHEAGRPSGELHGHVLHATRCAEVEDLVAKIYSADNPRFLLASITRGVIRLAQTDHVAAALVSEAADELATAIRPVVASLGQSSSGVNLVLTGGVAVASAEFRQRLLKALALPDGAIASVDVVADPAERCVLLADDARRR